MRFVLDSYGDGNRLAPLLDEEERARAARFRYERDRRRYVVSHALTRVVLGQCLRVSPASVRFHIGPHGKPRLAHAGANLHFNLSHAGHLALLAIGTGRAIGVDIQDERPTEVLELARLCFSPSEYGTLVSLLPEERISAFYRCWTRKESFVKARGDGLSFPLGGFDVSLDEDGAQLLLACDIAPSELERWTMVSLAVDAGYVAAVTAEGSGWRLSYWDAPSLARLSFFGRELSC